MGFGALLPGTALGNNHVHLDNTIAIDTTTPTPLTAEEALALDQFGGDVLESENAHRYYTVSTSSSSSSSSSTTMVQQEWTPEDVAKGMQDYLVCIEMFAFAIIHLFVFSHKEYEPKAVQARQRSLMQQPHKDWNKRLGRKWKEWDSKSAWSGTTRSSHEWSLNPTGSGSSQTMNNGLAATTTTGAASTGSLEEDDLLHHPMDRLEERSRSVESDGYDEEDRERKPLLSMEEEDVQHNHDSFYSMETSSLQDDHQDEEDSSSEADEEFHDEENPLPDETSTTWSPQQSSGRPKTGFVKALWDSAIPQDLRDNTVGIIKGDYVVEKKTLLHHAATSDTYDLFSRFHQNKKKRPTSIYAKSSEEDPK